MMSVSNPLGPTQPASHLIPKRATVPLSHQLVLVIAWCYEPCHTGEVMRVPVDNPGERWTFGRGMEGPPEALRLLPVRQHPSYDPLVLRRIGSNPSELSPRSAQEVHPILVDSLSRVQAEVQVLDSETLQITQLGSHNRLLHNGRVCALVRLKPGDVLEVENTLILLCTRRTQPALSWLASEPWPPFEFGSPDLFQMVGESPAMWTLREALMQRACSSHRHVLLHGPTGSGKEHAATALHRLTPGRGSRPLVVFNGAAITPSLADLELFGSEGQLTFREQRRSEGLLGRAQGSSLFIDEVAQLSPELQARLLRVLEPGGTLRRVGAQHEEPADFRCIAATNESLDLLRPDFRHRLGHPVELPALDARREDIPLLVEHLLLSWSKEPDNRRAQLTRRFIQWEDGRPRFLIHPSLTTWLLRRPWPGNIRELITVLDPLVCASQGLWLEPPPMRVGDASPGGWELERPLDLDGSEHNSSRRISALADSSAASSSVALARRGFPEAPAWMEEELVWLEELRRRDFATGLCDPARLGARGESNASYLLQRLIWRAMLHFPDAPEAALAAVLGAHLPHFPSPVVRTLQERFQNAAEKAEALPDDDPTRRHRNLTTEGFRLGLQVRDAMRTGALKRLEVRA